ncbi:unnamed protein product [Nesidiocoris tenuis]|uniref:Uncharacterized protein n=1 Tax=Nesidiocoris tenuis TaxID=355587 RepID=A0A6H5GK65_9HEMI|nr:unnamed protein product [Nesidiocoris tenuis]
MAEPPRAGDSRQQLPLAQRDVGQLSGRLHKRPRVRIDSRIVQHVSQYAPRFIQIGVNEFGRRILPPPSATVESSETADNGASANPSLEASDLQNSKDDDLLLNISSWDVSSVSDVSEVKERTDNPSPSLRLTGSNSSTPFRSKAGSSATEKSVLPLGDISLSIESIRPMLPSKAHGAFQHRIARPQSVSARRGDNSNHADRFADQGQESSTFLIRCEMRVSNAKFVFQEPILLKYVISYTTDEETITEMGQIDTLPMTED